MIAARTAMNLWMRIRWILLIANLAMFLFAPTRTRDISELTGAAVVPQ